MEKYSKKNLKNTNAFDGTNEGVEAGKRLYSKPEIIVTTQDRISTETGEVIETYKYKGNEKKAKRGWTKMYRENAREIMMKLADFPVALKVWIMLMGEFKKDGTIKPFKMKDLADKLGSNPATISRAFKKLDELEAVCKIDGEWRYNPFVIGVSGQSDIDLYDAQQIWQYHIGHYGKKVESMDDIMKDIKRKHSKQKLA